MKTLLTTLFALFLLSGFSQITRVTGKTTEGITENITEIHSKETNETLKLGYVANGSRIQEFKNYELVDVLTVHKVNFYSDKIFYAVTNSEGLTFGITFTFEDRKVFFCDANGNFTEVYGEGLSFAHQY